MKVLLTNFHEGDGGGHTTYLMALARGLRATHEVHVAAPPGSRLEREAPAIDGVRVLAQPFPNGLGKLGAWLRARRQLRDYLRTHDFDLIHVNGSADHRLVLSATKRLPRPPRVVWTKHNSKPLSGPGHRLRARRTDVVIAVSDATRMMLERSPYARCRLLTVRNGIDVERYRPWSDERARDARRHWCEDTHLLLGSNAGTAEHKGWLDLVEAVALLPETRRGAVDVLICGKPPTDAQQARVRALGLERQVHYAGMLSDVRPAIAAIDAGFVLSYAVETISFACREMMAMGKPVLVTDYAGLPENVDAGVDGWCVPVRDRAAIAAAIDTMLQDRARLQAMGDAARAKAEREFDVAGFVAGVEAAYRDVMVA